MARDVRFCKVFEASSGDVAESSTETLVPQLLLKKKNSNFI